MGRIKVNDKLDWNRVVQALAYALLSLSAWLVVQAFGQLRDLQRDFHAHQLDAAGHFATLDAEVEGLKK